MLSRIMWTARRSSRKQVVSARGSDRLTEEQIPTCIRLDLGCAARAMAELIDYLPRAPAVSRVTVAAGGPGRGDAIQICWEPAMRWPRWRSPTG